MTRNRQTRCTEENNLPGLLLLVDFEKAFDSVSWSFIYKVLEYFGYGKSIISWIKLFNNNAKLRINQGGNLSTFFHIGRGCRHGDPISPFIFILCAEILAIMIRKNKNIKGIIINNREHKLSQYADDTVFMLDGKEKSLKETLNVLFEFSRFSGLNVNFDKTHAVWIGAKKYSTAAIKTRWKLSWGKTDFKLLGINFHVDLDRIQRINYTEKIHKIKNLIILWKRRNLTPLGKITVIKTLLLPILNHLFISIPNPREETLKEINDIFFEFLWTGPAKIKHKVVVKQYCEGGLNMINLKAFVNSMKLTWLRRVILSDSPWQSVVDNKINFQELFSLGRSYIDSLSKNVKNKFWIDVLRAFSELLSLQKNITQEFVLSSSIFHNPEIKVGGKPLWIKTWYQKGLLYVNDLLAENGNFYSQTDIERKYNIKTNFVQFQGMIQAVKLYARRNYVENFTKKLEYPIIPNTIALFTKSKKGGKIFYIILNKNEEKPTSQSKWENIYNIEDDTWNTIYCSPFKLNIGTKLQWFQTKINHRILPTRKFLHTIKYIQNPNCHFCNQEETISHMLWSCQETQSLIRDFSRWLRIKNINLTFTEELFIFNIGNTYSTADLHIFIIMKNYIFISKRQNQPLSMTALKNRINYFFKLGQYTATKNNDLYNFEHKWQKYKEVLQSIH